MGKTLKFNSYCQFILAAFLVLGHCLNSYSQCPTVTNPTQSFCDIDSPTIANLSAINNGNGIKWYATAVSTSPLSNGIGLVNGEDYYADDNSGTCGMRQRVDVTIFGPPAGLSFQGVCVDDPNDATIADLIATGNDIQWYSVPSGGTALSPSTILMDNTIYYVNQSNPNTGCRTSRLSVFVNVGVVPVPIGEAIQEFCSNLQPPPTVADLQASGNINWYSTVSSASPLDPSTPLIDGQNYFATTIDPPCESIERLEIFVVFKAPLDSGSSGTIDFCETDLETIGNVNLFDSLGGMPDTTGTWTGPFPTSNGNLGTLDISSLSVIGSPYVFTYSVSSNACGISTSAVTVIVLPSPNAGTNGTLDICGNDSPVNLFDSLGGTPDAGGTWSPALASGSGIFDPTVDSAGTYTYNVIGMPPCGDASATVTVTVNPMPNAGTNGTLDICTNNSPVDLFDSLGGTPDAGGTWSPTLASGTGIFDPTMDAAGIYTYTVTGIPPCGDDSATVTVTIIPLPIAGTNGALTLCENDAPADLFDSLGGTPDAGGTWSPALNSGTGIFDPTVDAAGTYTYTVIGTPPCANASATVTVTLNSLPIPGTNGSLNICENDAPVDLFNSLGGTPDSGGIWSPALASGTGIFDPAVDAAGTYTYTITGTPPCGDVSATVTVTINTLPIAGTNGALTLCENDAPVDLFNSLGGTPDVGGTWSPALNSGTGIFDPTVDAAGTYTYTVIGTPPCANASATVTVTLNPLPIPGINGTLAICENDAPVDLFDSLGGTPDAGGTWSPALASGSGIFDPTVDTAGTYTYTVTGTPPCGDVSATVTVTINPIPDAGTNGALMLCENDAPVDFFDSLGGTPDAGGTWSPALASGTGIFDPNVDTAGTYTYTVIGTPPCGNASATVTVTINPIPDAGTNGSLALCENDAPVDLFDSLGGTPDLGGTWSPALASGSGSGIFDPTVDTAGTYTYTVLGIPPCGDASATVTVTINPIPDAGTDGSLNICGNDTPVDLFDSLGGNPDAGGIWSPALTSGTGIFDPTVDVAGTYTYTLSGATICGMASATVTVSIIPQPNVTGLTIMVDSVCLNNQSEVTITGANQLADGPYSLTYNLSGANTSQTTIMVTIMNGSTTFNIPATLLTNPGITTFTVLVLISETTSCGADLSSISSITFNIIQDPSPELITGGNSFCLEDNPTIADLSNNILGTIPVVWYDALENGTPYAASDLLSDGTTYYASSVLEGGCDNSVRLAVTVSIQTCEILELIIPDGFSPNGDAINDDFLIKNLRTLFPDFKLQIYNRYGNILYEGDINTPDWNGTSNKGRELGNSILPVGVYFFILELNDSTNRTIQGRVYLSR